MQVNLKEIVNEIIFLEEKEKLFGFKINEVYIWKKLRFLIMNEVVKKQIYTMKVTF